MHCSSGGCGAVMREFWGRMCFSPAQHLPLLLRAEALWPTTPLTPSPHQLHRTGPALAGVTTGYSHTALYSRSG